MKLLYIVTKGADDATLASVPLHIAANGSLEVGQEDNARSIEGVGVPPLRDLLGKLEEHRVPVYV
jgi:hypothetical protein